MRKPILLILLLSLFITSCDNSLKITDSGQSAYTIIIPEHASYADSTAASYLAKYIHQMTGVDILVHDDRSPESAFEICIGRTNRFDPIDDLEPDAFVVKFADNKMINAGGKNKGSIYAVIELLERWGCRKFSPTESYIPTHDILSISPVGLADSPLNGMRIINGQMTTDDEYADWLRITTIPEVAPPGYYVHTFHRLIPREEFFAEHPVDEAARGLQKALESFDLWRELTKREGPRLAEYLKERI